SVAGGGTAGVASAGAGVVERGLEQVVERAQPDLVASGDRTSGSDQMGAGAALLVGHNRFQHAVDYRVQAFNHRVVLVESGAVDLDDEFRAGRIERPTLERLDR